MSTSTYNTTDDLAKRLETVEETLSGYSDRVQIDRYHNNGTQYLAHEDGSVEMVYLKWSIGGPEITLEISRDETRVRGQWYGHELVRDIDDADALDMCSQLFAMYADQFERTVG